MSYHNDIGYCSGIGYCIVYTFCRLGYIHYQYQCIHVAVFLISFGVSSTSKVFIEDTFIFDLPFLRGCLQYIVKKSYIILPLIVMVHAS